MCAVDEQIQWKHKPGYWGLDWQKIMHFNRNIMSYLAAYLMVGAQSLICGATCTRKAHIVKYAVSKGSSILQRLDQLKACRGGGERQLP